MTADMLSNKILNLIVTQLFITGKKLNISLIFITQPYSALPKNNILNFTHLLLWKFQINENFNKLHIIIYQVLTLKTLVIFIKYVLQNLILFFLVTDATLASDNPSRFRKNF